MWHTREREWRGRERGKGRGNGALGKIHQRIISIALNSVVKICAIKRPRVAKTTLRVAPLLLHSPPHQCRLLLCCFLLVALPWHMVIEFYHKREWVYYAARVYTHFSFSLLFPYLFVSSFCDKRRVACYVVRRFPDGRTIFFTTW